MNRQKFKLINEITYLVKTDTQLLPNINLELLHKTLESDVIFYLPDPMTFTDFIKFYCDLIVEKYKKIEKIYIFLEDNTNKRSELYEDKFSQSVIIITDKTLPIVSDNSILIFDDLKNIGSFNDLVSKNDFKLSQFICKFGYTTSPFLFYDMVTSTGLDFTSYAPVVFGQNTRWFYKKALERTEIRNFKKLEDEIYLDEHRDILNENLKNLSQYINFIKNQGNIDEKNIAKRLVFLLINGLYKQDFILEVLLKDDRFQLFKDKLRQFDFTSHKIFLLINEIINSEFKDICILFNSSEILEIVFNILIHELQNIETQKKLQNEISKNYDNIKKKIFLNDKCIQFITYIEFDSNNGKDLIICYDYKPVHTIASKIIFYPIDRQGYFVNLLNFEKKIEMEIRRNCKIPELLRLNNKIDNKRIFNIKIHTDKALEIDSVKVKNFNVLEIDQKKKIVKIEKMNNFSYVGFLLNEQLKEPLELEYIKPNFENISISALDIEFGTIADHKSFMNSFKLQCHSFVFLRRDVIAIYCFGADFTYKIKISISCFEKIFFVEKKDFLLNFYLCLSRKPKIYATQKNTVFLENWTNVLKMKSSERYSLFENFIWNRCSINEIPFIDNRADVKISFDLKNGADMVRIKDFVAKIKNKHCEDTSKLKIKIYDVVDCLISFFVRFQNTNIIFTELKSERNGFLGYKEISEYFLTRNFDDYYYFMCLFSQKSRYLIYNITKEDIEKFDQYNTYSLVNYLLSALSTRFTNVSSLIQNYKDIIYNQQERKMRQIIITPFEVIYKMPVAFESNRILREFDYEKFLRVSLREEDFKTKIKDTATKDQNLIYDHYRNILNEGIFIGPRKYFFVAMTTSQMKLHNAWFLTPYFSNNILIGPDYIRNWLGDFSNIKNVGKYAMRLGQALSSTIPTIDINNFIEIEDNIKNGYNFTDGIGVISLSYAKIISQKLGLEEIPSAFQIRFGGYKGVIVAYPINEEDLYIYNNFNINEQLLHAVYGLLRSGKNENFKRHKLDDVHFVDFNQQNKLIEALGNNRENSLAVILRSSMRKFVSNHKNMECITHSSTNPCFLNRQIINLLEGLGIDVSVFLEHQDDYILSLLEEMYNNPINYVRKSYGGLPCISNIKDLRIFKKLLLQVSNKIVRELYKKNKILIRHGAVLMGTVDELKVLRENEVFIKVKKDMVGIYDNFIIDGDYCIVIGPCIIAKNPCLHPGDIRKVIGVNKPELGFLRSVLVFNQSGNRPISNMCSGSDLDGDMYTVIWEKSLIPLTFYEPSSYEDQTFLSKEVVCLRDIVNFYIRYIRNYHLGSIAHAHMVYCDLNDVKSENAKLLAELFNKSIDFPKTGFVASVPESLVPLSYPDFLQIRGNVYQSIKSLGILFRRSFSSLLNTNLKCECHDCLLRFIDSLPNKTKLIFQGSKIKYKIFKDNYATTKKEDQFFEKFKRDILCLMKRFNLRKEDDLLLQFPTENDETFFESILKESTAFFKRTKIEIKNKKPNEIGLLQRSEDCTENINSLPLSFIDHKYTFTYKNLYKSKKENFIYNSKICINEINLEINNKHENHLPHENFENTQIDVFTDAKIYKKFMNNINRSCDQVFEEVFNLLFLADFFDSLSFDLVLVFLLFLQSKIKSPSKLDVARGLLKISREFYKNPTDKTLYYFIYKVLSNEKGNLYLINIKYDLDIRDAFTENKPEVKLAIDYIGRVISNVAYLLVFEINLVQKYLSMKNLVFENNQKIQPEQTFIKKIGFGDLVIKGMFDTSDQLKLEIYKGIKHILHKNIRVYTPNLMNKGFCDIETHKINVKEFFINAYFNCLYSRILKNEKKMSDITNYIITITLTPGKFYIYDVPNNYINETMTIESLISSLQFYKKSFNENDRCSLKSYFFNNNELIDEDTRSEYMKKKDILFKDNFFTFTFSMFFNNIRYQIYYKKSNGKFIIQYITKGRCVAGKLFVINDLDTKTKDSAFEIMYEEIIFKDNFNTMSVEESEIFREPLIEIQDKTFIVSKTLKNCKNFRFEIDNKLQVSGKNNIELINRKIFTGNRDIFTLENRHERLVVCSVTTNEDKNIGNVTEFMEIFERTWSNFIKFYA